MTDLLTTAVSETITRVLAMEKLAVTASVGQSKEWIHWEQQVPYWTNRIGGFVTDGQHQWTMTIIARLVLSHLSQATAGSTSPAEAVWGYVPNTLRYFNRYRDLKPPALTEIKYLAPQGITINARSGMDIFNIPGQTFTALYVDFSIEVPFLIYD